MKYDTMIVALGEPGSQEEFREFTRHVNDGWELLAVRASGNRPLFGDEVTLSYWRKPRD